jgi:histidyl-tRNA synthetase
MQKPSLPKGTRDFTPQVMFRRKRIMDTIEAVFKCYGFLPIETPAMETLSTLSGKYGEEGDKLLFKVLNSGNYLADIPSTAWVNQDHREITPLISEKGLRYDLTVPLARFVVQNRNELQMPFRRYQMQPVWRADRPQKGRYREFWQCDADIIGSDSLINEVELLNIYQNVFSALGLKVKVMVNHRKILEGMAEVMGIKEHFRALTIAIDKFDKVGITGVLKELEAVELAPTKTIILQDFLESFELNGVNLEKLDKMLETSEVGRQGIAELRELLHLSQVSGLSQTIWFNGTLARGLDYYTGCIFEVVSEEVPMGSISGGGRYDNLTGVFGIEGLSGVGISFGIDRIYDVMESLGLFNNVSKSSTKILICHFDQKGLEKGLETAQELRRNLIPTELYPDVKKIQKQFDYANKRSIPYVLLWGENELAEGKPTLKDMVSGKQKSISLDELITLIREEGTL